MIKMTPPMGWNSWNTFGANISESLIIETADRLVDSGLRDHGYEYLVIDDCWSMRERDKDGRLVADPEKFPHGMKYVSDYIHSKGLKFGMYSCAGPLTCAGYPGSGGHEFIDAATFAEWGVDLLKYDYCFHSNVVHGKYLYRRMGLALANCGRDILFSACSWGNDGTAEWIRETGAGMWRSTGDIYDNWESVKSLTEQQEKILPYGGAGCFNDMDMLVVGMYGKGNVGLSGLSDTQYKTHFSIWALFASPLMIGCDIRNMNDKTYEILTNKKLIEINQDCACRQVIKLQGTRADGNSKIFARNLDNGDIALGFFNLDDAVAGVVVNLDELGLPPESGKTLLAEDVWSGEKLTVKNDCLMYSLDPCDCKVFRCKVIDA